MVMDMQEWLRIRRAAQALLQDRYGEGNEVLTAEEAVTSVAASLAVRPVSADEVLAALSHLGQARGELDGKELALMRTARAQGVSQRIAGALGLHTRQSAESRALRLQRALSTDSGEGTRSVAAARREKAHRRAQEASRG
ncbi:hypothetical protein [Streptomyces sp. NPDC046939]|uniref:hypothetical protein n=1 Tax=Streptomyces sp. NPDC046939 TaxID=3155376 RepID=UPI003409B737